MTPPRYQAITDQSIPAVQLPNKAGTLRVIAGDYQSQTGPANTFTPMHVWDLALNSNGIAELEVPEGWHSAVVVLKGTVEINRNTVMRDAQMALLSQGTAPLSGGQRAGPHTHHPQWRAHCRAHRRLRTLCDEYTTGNSRRCPRFQ